MKRLLASTLPLFLAACGLTESSTDDHGSGGMPSVGGDPMSGVGGATVSAGGRAPGTGGAQAPSGGHSSLGGTPHLETGGAPIPGDGGASSGGAAAGGAGVGGASSGGAAAGGAGGAPCGCQIELDPEGVPRSCEMFGGTLGDDALVWVCNASPIPFNVFEDAGCQGLPTGLYRTCCPPELTITDVCPD